MKRLTKKQSQILSEIYRRLNYFHKGNLDANLMLLALPSMVKCLDSFDIIEPLVRELPRCWNWYSLTKHGKEFFKNYVKPLSEKENHDLFCLNRVKTFDPSLL